MCGSERVDKVKMPEVSDPTFRLCCMGSTGKVSRQRSGSILRTRPHQEEVRTKCSGFHSQNCKKCVKQSWWHESDEKKQEVQRNLRVRKASVEKSIARRSWINETQDCKGNYEIQSEGEKYKEEWQQKLQDVGQRRNDHLQEHQKMQK